MNKIKNKTIDLFKGRSKFLFGMSLIESIFSIWFLAYFNQVDRMNYADSIVESQADLALLIKNMYTSTWWGLLILVICLIAIFSLISFIYKDEKYQLISFMLWFILLILSINTSDTFKNNLSNLFILIPIMVMSYVAFRKQKSFSK